MKSLSECLVAAIHVPGQDRIINLMLSEGILDKYLIREVQLFCLQALWLVALITESSLLFLQ